MVVEIAFNLPLRQNFDYLWAEHLNVSPQKGIRVLVPFGTQKKSGVIVKIKASSEFSDLKEVELVLDGEPIFHEKLLELTRWVAEYYFCSWGEVLSCAIPGGFGLRFHTSYKRSVESNQLKDLQSLDSPLQKLIQTRNTWSRQDWLKAGATERDHRLLDRWLKEKSVERIQTFAGTNIKSKFERWVRLKKIPDTTEKKDIRKQTKKEKILLLLQKHSAISLAELKNHVPTPAHAVKNLKEEGIVEIFEQRVYRRFLQTPAPPRETFFMLNESQELSYRRIESAIEEEKYQSFLIHGVTGSGKTEVYLHCVRKALTKGKQSLMLVPEISLTPQLVDRFRARFGDCIAVLHSGMDDAERFDEWYKILLGEASIVVGARSAVFAPLDNIGLIIVDEEHDTSYKQEESPRYNGRDVAIFRGYRAGATVVLGSATPSLESYLNITKKKYHLLTLPSRIHQRELPDVELVNLKNCVRQKGSYFFSIQMVEALRTRLLKKEQSLLFLNRRGFATMLHCTFCESAITCPNCSLCLVYHQSVGMLQCHLCDHTMPLLRYCPQCKAKELKIRGVGTEQIASELQTMFPQARILRMDRDTLHRKNSLSRMLEQIATHQVDIVIGTQLVTKGHDFANITFVGVILADLSLNFPDFRAAERTFQLLTQVAGRAGRGNKPGKVLIQTYNPSHHSLQCTQDHDFSFFQQREFHIRQQLKVPPFVALALVRFSSLKENRAQALANSFYQNLMTVSKIEFESLGPSEAPIKKINNRYRWMVILKAPQVKHLHFLLQSALHFPTPLNLRSEERIAIDVDPYNFQ